MRLKVTEHWEPDLCPEGISLLQGAVVGQGVVVEEHAGRDVECNEHVNGVVFVGCQDEEDAKHVQHPGEDVQVVHSSGSICKSVIYNVKWPEFNVYIISSHGSSKEHWLLTTSLSLFNVGVLHPTLAKPSPPQQEVALN